ncbi:Uma2 family endonuclease [Anaerolineales bacterium HSG24]|nr:Uma2 family endonuclease [Anaerolineales bacterium HSG24]
MQQLMTATQTKPTVEKINYEQFLQQYMGYHAEWINGEVIVFMAASSKHQNLVMWLSAILHIFVETCSLGLILPAPFNMKMARIRRGREPDILFVTKARQHLIQYAHLAGPADLAIEIISPESAERDRVTKFREYETAGVKEYWLIDPETEDIEFYQLTATGYYQRIFPNSNGVYHSAVLSGFGFDVNWLQQKPLPQVLSIAKTLGLLGEL